MKHLLPLILIPALLAGCSSAPTAAPVLPSTVPSSPIPATATFTPSPLPPTITPLPSATAFIPRGTIKIFSLGPLSGDLAIGGTDTMRGAELAVKQLAGPLLDLGYQVELVPYDDQSKETAAVTGSKEIISDPDILCGVGPYTSRSLNQVKEVFHQAKLGFISPSATAAFVTDSGYPEVNRVVGRHDGQGAAGAQFAKEQGFSRIFVISHSENYAQFNARSLRNEAGRLGIEVVGNMTTDAAKDFKKIIERILSTGADLVYFSTLNVEQAGTFFREARAAGYTGTFLGNEGISNPALLEFAGPLLLDGGGMYYTAIGAPAGAYPGAANFVEDFETRFGSTPRTFAAQAYDAAGICMKAIEQASIARGGEIPTREEVASRIRGLQEYQGITGVYHFNEYGDPDPAQYFVFQVASIDPTAWDQNPLQATFDITPPE